MLVGMATRPWLGLLWRSRLIRRERLRDALEITARGLQLLPLALRERQLYAQKLRAHSIDPQPVFIIGHFRSGTTHLHSLLARDLNFAFPTTFQVLFPRVFLSAEGWLKPLLRKGLPTTRCFDNVQLDVDSPQEDEFALGHLSPFSFYHGLYFPRQLHYHLRRGVLLENARDRKSWQHLYRSFLNKLSLRGNGRPLLLKNPANSARIETLLEIFPRARFIHVYRNPYATFYSMLRAGRIFSDAYAFHRLSETQLHESILLIYEQLMRHLFRGLDAIPSGQLVHVCYENLIGNELATLQAIYRGLGLGGFAHAHVGFEQYLGEQAAFRTSHHQPDPTTAGVVQKRWAFGFARLGYAEAAAPTDGPRHNTLQAVNA